MSVRMCRSYRHFGLLTEIEVFVIDSQVINAGANHWILLNIDPVTLRPLVNEESFHFWVHQRDFIIYAPWVHHKQTVRKDPPCWGSVGLIGKWGLKPVMHPIVSSYTTWTWKVDGTTPIGLSWPLTIHHLLAVVPSTFTTMCSSCQLKLQPHRPCKFELRQHMPATASLKAFLFRQPVAPAQRHKMIPITASHHFGYASKRSCVACLMMMKILGVGGFYLVWHVIAFWDFGDLVLLCKNSSVKP